MKTRYNIDIDKIILYDFAPGQAMYIKRAIQLELSRLFTDEKVIPVSRDINKDYVISGNSINIEANTSNESIGKQIAQSIYKDISQ